MHQIVSCGFILAEPRGILICHPTSGGNRWDFPKGRVNQGEDHLDAAIRETFEETGLVLNKDVISNKVVDLGRHGYNREKDLHMFCLELDKIDVTSLQCTSYFEDHRGKIIPEMDAFILVRSDNLLTRLGQHMQLWMKEHFLNKIGEIQWLRQS